MSPTLPIASRRCFIASGAALAAAAAWPAVWAAAQDKPLRILVGFPPGGGSDVIARLLAEKLKDVLQRPVMVDNRPGAGGQLAAQWLKAAPADGTAVLLSHDHTMSILPLVLAHPGYDPHADFVPLGGVASFVNGLAVAPGTPARSLAQYVAWVKAQGGKSAVGIPAPASTPEFLVQLLAKRYGLDLVAVPYKGSAPMIADMLGQQIPAGIGSSADFIEHLRSGKLHMLAVVGAQRQAVLPDVPTFGELGFAGLEDTPFYGVWAPRGVPAPFVADFSRALAKVLALPDVHQQLTDMGLSVGFMAPEQLDARERAYRAAWARIIRGSGFRPQ